MNDSYSPAMGAPQSPTPLLLLGPTSTMVDCPFCHATVKSTVEFTSNILTHIAAAMCCRFFCCCIPYCSDSAKNTDHYCPQCSKYLGTYNK